MSHPPDFWGGTGGCQVSVVNALISYTCVMTAPLNPERVVFRELPGRWPCGDSGRVVHSAWELLSLFPYLAIYIAFICLFLSISLYDNLVM